VVEIASKEQHFMIELFERIEKSLIDHVGTHKITIDGITIEGPIKPGIEKVVTLKGNFSINVKKKKK